MNQKELLGKLAHDLRNPLSILKINIELALLGDIDSKLEQNLHSNLQELDRMSALIDEFQKNI